MGIGKNLLKVGVAAPVTATRNLGFIDPALAPIVNKINPPNNNKQEQPVEKKQPLLNETKPRIAQILAKPEKTLVNLADFPDKTKQVPEKGFSLKLGSQGFNDRTYTLPNPSKDDLGFIKYHEQKNEQYLLNN